MFFDRSEVVEELAPIFESNIPCIKKSVFLQFLDIELRRAERYGSYVSLLLFRLQNGTAERPALFSDYVRFMKTKLRRTDYVANMENETLGVILLNSKLDNTTGVLKRLAGDSTLYLKARDTHVNLQASSSVYPTEATSRDGLCSTATERLSTN